MVRFALGLQLSVNDRDIFEEFIDENAHDHRLHHDVWSPDSIPQAIYIVEFKDSDKPYYVCLDEYINGNVSRHCYNEDLLRDLIDEGLLVKDGHDEGFIEKHK